MLPLIYGMNRVVTKEYVPKETKKEILAKIDTLTLEEKEAKKSGKGTPALPDGELSDWNLVLVGPSHEGKEAQPDGLSTLDNGMIIDSRIVDSYNQMLLAAQADGIDLMLVSAYRSISYQEQIFNQNVQNLMMQGETQESATQIVKQTSTEPGFSEHHTGLSIDIVDHDWSQNYTGVLLNQGYADTKGGQWLATHAREYGFILRYPKDRQSITEITFEPWHYRYVGVEHSTYIEENQLTLEEYLERLKEK